MWQRWLPTESWADNWRRIANQAEEGIALRTHQLGIKMAENDPRYAQMPCVWRAGGIHVQDLLTRNLAFTSLWLSKKSGTTRSGMAAHGDKAEVLQRDVEWTGEGDIGEVVIVKEARRRKPEAFTRLRQERIGNFIVPKRSNRTRDKPAVDVPAKGSGKSSKNCWPFFRDCCACIRQHRAG